MAAGTDGLIIEVHYRPAEALCDADQALTIDGFKALMRRLRGLQGYLEQDTRGEVTE